MKISLLEPLGITEERVEELAENLKKEGHTFTYYDKRTTDIEELKKRSKGQDIVMVANNPYPDEAVMAADKLKMIAVAFTGIDHIGLKACKEKGVMVCNCAGYSNQSVAELVIGMTISLYRKLGQCDTAVRSGATSNGLTGMEIRDKIVGIVGCGRIGIQTAKLFHAFGARVLAYARHEKEEWEKEGIHASSMDELLAKSDIVSIHLPLNNETKGFLGKDKIEKMKRGSILINCARGPIVDNGALAIALQEGKIAGAAVDVFDMEPPIPADCPLSHAPNTLLTPHIAFLTQESMERRAEIEFRNVYKYVQGMPDNVCTF